MVKHLTNSKIKGDYAVSLATVYFLYNNYQVLFPYGDRGHYDLVVEKDGIFQRVQSKLTTRLKKPQNYYCVSLNVSGSAKKENNIALVVSHTYNITDFDLLWVTTPVSCYLIPFKDILNGRATKRDLKLYPKWDKYKVAIPIPARDENSSNVRVSPRLTMEDKATIKQLLKANKTEREIANILNVSESCISVQKSRNKEFYKT